MKSLEQALVAIGHNIRRHRLKRKISQEELAVRCGLHRTYLSDVERGARNLSFGSLLAIAQGLNITVAELVRKVEVPLEQ